MSPIFFLLLQILAKTSAVNNFLDPFGAVKQRNPFFGNLGAQFGVNWWRNLKNPQGAPGNFLQRNDPRLDGPGKIVVPERPTAKYVEATTLRPNSEDVLIEKIPLPVTETLSDPTSRPILSDALRKPIFSNTLPPAAYNLPPGYFRGSWLVPGYRTGVLSGSLPYLPRGGYSNNQPLLVAVNPVYSPYSDEHPLISQVYQCLLRLWKVLREDRVSSLGEYVVTRPFKYAHAVEYDDALAVNGCGRVSGNELERYAGRKITFPKVVKNIVRAGGLIKGIGQTVEGIIEFTEKKDKRGKK